MDIGALISTGSLVFAALGVWLTLVSLRADHERSRRVQAIDLMKFYYGVIRESHLLMPCLRLADSLGPAELLSLVDGRRDIDVVGEAREMAEMIAEAKGFKIDTSGGTFTLGREGVFYVRQQIFSFLNAQEVLAAAWSESVIGAEIFEREFKSAFIPSSGKPPLTDFIEKSGIYPATKAVHKHFSEEVEVTVRPKIA